VTNDYSMLALTPLTDIYAKYVKRGRSGQGSASWGPDDYN